MGWLVNIENPKEFSYHVLLNLLKLGVTIVANYDYCDSIDIARSAIAIILLLWTTIAILFCDCLKHICLFEGGN